jgi:hypothetical protein
MTNFIKIGQKIKRYDEEEYIISDITINGVYLRPVDISLSSLSFYVKFYDLLIFYKPIN